jgi:hypothetical protein
MKMFVSGVERSRRDIKLDYIRDVGRLVEGEHFKCKKSDYKADTIVNQ